MARCASGKHFQKKARETKGGLGRRAANARHEAAHAVVASRLGLPLLFTTIEQNAAPMRPLEEMGPLPPEIIDLRSFGFTTLVKGTVDGWIALLPRQDARVKLEGFAAMAAAGMVAEVSLGNTLQDPECRDDTVSMVEVTAVLGVGNSTEMPKVRDFMAGAYRRAASILLDNEAGWDQVAEALFHRGRLSGEEVAEILTHCKEEEEA